MSGVQIGSKANATYEEVAASEAAPWELDARNSEERLAKLSAEAEQRVSECEQKCSALSRQLAAAQTELEAARAQTSVYNQPQTDQKPAF